MVKEQVEAPHLRPLQNRLANEMTILVHGQEALETSVEASQILFGRGSTQTLKNMDETTFLSVFEGVPIFTIEKKELLEGINIVDLLAEKSSVFPSKGEMRRTLAGGGLQLNKEKIEQGDRMVDANDLLNGKYLLVQKGKKSFYLLIAE